MTSFGRISALLLVCGCGGTGLAPETVTSAWAKRSLRAGPDVVVSLDVVAMRADTFYAKVADLVLADSPASYDAVLAASRIDLFGTVSKSFTAVVYDAGPPPPELARCLSSDARLSVSRRDWIVSSAPVTASGVPDEVSMDGGAIFEAWLGPGAFDEGLRRARWNTPDMWRRLHAMRIRLEGGETPGLVVDASFETPVDAVHAANDLARAERTLARLADDEKKDDEGAKLVVEQLANVRVTQSGAELHVSTRLTPELTRWMSAKLDEARHPARARRQCP